MAHLSDTTGNLTPGESEALRRASRTNLTQKQRKYLTAFLTKMEVPDNEAINGANAFKKIEQENPTGDLYSGMSGKTKKNFNL